LSGAEVLALLNIFEDWSGLRLEHGDQVAVLIRAKSAPAPSSMKAAKPPAQTADSVAPASETKAAMEVAGEEDDEASSGT
jgi:hypothetical protein